MKTNKVLFITQEITPFVQESTIANIGRTLPQATQESGKDIRVFMPKWGTINIRRNQLHEVQRLTGMNLIIDDTDHPLIIKVASLQAARMQVYFIDNDDYFQNRLMATDENGKEYPDNDERTIFFSRGVLETIKKQHWCPDVIHCHGWISALAPLYVKTAYNEEPSFRDSKVVISLYDENFSEQFPESFLAKTLYKNMSIELLDGIASPTSYEELAKIAIRYSDGIILNGDNISPALIEYAESLGKPILAKPSDETYAEECNKFYETL